MLRLLAPDFAALDTLWRQPLPFALWPVGHQSLLAHWMDEAVRRGETEVVIHAADRPAEIRRHLEGGHYWSRKVQIVPMRDDSEAPPDAIPAWHLPGIDAPAERPSTAPALLQHWLQLQRDWLTSRTAGVTVDVQRVPGGWTGPRARIHPDATLRPPFWIGTAAVVGAGCTVGPHALIGPGSVLDGSVHVEEAVVLPDTYLGRNTRLHQALAQGGVLVDIARGCRVDIHERFILAPVSTARRRVPLLSRLAGLLAWFAVAPVAALWPGQTWTRREVTDTRGDVVPLRTGSRGPLLVRRAPWLLLLAGGRLHGIGILPRTAEDWAHVPEETADRLREAPCGVLSWADLHDCHDSTLPDEWLHAAWQALQEGSEVERAVRRRCLSLAFKTPARA